MLLDNYMCEWEHFCITYAAVIPIDRVAAIDMEMNTDLDGRC